MGMIHIDYGEIVSKSEKIVDCGVEIQRDAQRMKEQENFISSAWKGDAARLYLKKYDKHVYNMEKHAKTLKDNADRLKASAERMKKIDEFGKNIFSR